jgi:DNA-binding MarR family transcriptional regulator
MTDIDRLVDEIHSDVSRLTSELPASGNSAQCNGSAGEQASRDPAVSLEELVATFRCWLHLPDPGALLAVLGAVAANHLEGDPVWLLLVGPPGGGKSELLASLVTLPGVHPTATLTEAALLSGTPRHERDADAKGGLLRSIGDFGLIVCKDFGSILSMNRDARAQVLAALREVYDGSWTRHVGTNGGKTLHWSGKVGLIAGCTPTIDRHHAVMGAMGERFALFRLPEVDGDEQASRALAHAGREAEMRRALAAAVSGFLSRALDPPHPLGEEERTALISFATLAVRARSAVERDSYSREIELIPDPEAPTRLIVVLERLLDGLDVIGVPRPDAWRVVSKVALDSIPAIRRTVLEYLYPADGHVTTTEVAAALGYPTSTTRRALEDLAAHSLVKRTKPGGGEGTADLYKLTEWSRKRLGTFPEKSSNTCSSRENERIHAASDVSGTVGEAENPDVQDWR